MAPTAIGGLIAAEHAAEAAPMSSEIFGEDRLRCVVDAPVGDVEPQHRRRRKRGFKSLAKESSDCRCPRPALVFLRVGSDLSVEILGDREVSEPRRAEPLQLSVTAPISGHEDRHHDSEREKLEQLRTVAWS